MTDKHEHDRNYDADHEFVDILKSKLRAWRDSQGSAVQAAFSLFIITAGPEAMASLSKIFVDSYLDYTKRKGETRS